MKILLVSLLMICSFTFCCGAEELEVENIKVMALPAAQTDIGEPLMKALFLRRSTREYSSKALSRQDLSNLLWAATGINRAESGMITNPTAHNWQEIEVYAALEDGLYFYNRDKHVLERILTEDIREATGQQPFVKDAPVNLIIVANYDKMKGAPEEAQEFFSATDAGFVSQNIYLYCASQGLATVVRAWFDEAKLTKIMNLGSNKKIILCQTVGHFKHSAND